ncbi:venom protease-like isoform X2 [Armigeres subalbatus]|uniref:venom protease-like isoform X2 n=1 Tax=Armigeres subalbatus TaxID=124917 RepID=UPI002ECFEFC7
MARFAATKRRRWSTTPTWMSPVVALIVLIIQMRPGSAVLKENSPCELNGSPGTCRPYATCREEVQNNVQFCGHSIKGAIVCCPTLKSNLENRDTITEPSQRKAVRKCQEYRQLASRDVAAISLSLASFIAHAKVPTCDSITKLIVGGTVTKPGEFPHMAALGWRQTNGAVSFKCGGSLISERFVLTAAHCYEEVDGVFPSFVRLGDQHLFREDDGASPKEYTIDEFIMHPDFKRRQGKYNDIALIKLTEAVIFNRNIRPACLYDQVAVPKKPVIATGFGSTGVAEDFSNELMKVSLKVYDNKLCSEAFAGSRDVRKGVVEEQLCAGDIDGDYDTCQGDSGGPLQITEQSNHCSFTLLGITSIGQGCGGTIPAIYTRVASYLDWIESTVWP